MSATGRSDIEAKLDELLDRVRDDDAARQEFVDLLEAMGRPEHQGIPAGAEARVCTDGHAGHGDADHRHDNDTTRPPATSATQSRRRSSTSAAGATT